MKRINVFLLICYVSGQLFAQRTPTVLPQLGKNKIEEVVAAMSLEEKIELVMGLGDATWTNPPEGNKTVIVNGIAGRTWDIPRLGIPPTVMADGPAGLRIDPLLQDASLPRYCTAFPAATSLASTWNTMLVEKVGKAMGNEVLEYGCDVLLSPAMNIQRNPLAGRNFEYYSEDPYISGKMGASMVRGLQSNGIGASVKHFVANNQETNRKSINEIISQRALREIYLRGFEITIKESEPWTVMSSYNRVNGFHTAENRELLTTILRDEWGYKGLVTTDWWSGTDATSQMYAGNDLLMPGCYQREELMQAVADRRLDEKTLNRNVTRILEYIMKTPRYKGYRFSNRPDLAAHALVAQQAAEEGMVLLKNDNHSLPLSKNRRVALFGKTSYNFIAGGTGSGEVNYEHAVSLQEGLENNGFSIVKPLEKFYVHFIDSVRNRETKDKKHVLDFMDEVALSKDEIREQVAKSDLAIITIGRSAGEGWDRKEQDYFLLSAIERKMIKEISEVYHKAGKKVIVVLNIGGVMETASWKEYPDAILLAWQSGQQGGAALADILKGTVNPSGKLPVTFPLHYSDVPSATTFPGEPLDNPINSFYNEGIYVGYRYYDSFNVKPSYEFGYGLSYTDFQYSNMKLTFDASTLTVKAEVTIKNIGKRAGKEIVQAYLSAPSDKIEKPMQELKGFVKTKLLKSGESEMVVFELDARLLASYWSGISSWIADAGIYQLSLGSSSRDIRAQSLFTLGESKLVEKTNYVLQPNYMVKEFSIKDKKLEK
nr:glycoside hydrolase family 3 C-terminal domain-containing protein [uncultured Bacteroides sp.]